MTEHGMPQLRIRLWAQQMVLAYLDAQPDTARAVAGQIAAATDVTDRWRVAVDELMQLHLAWTTNAVQCRQDELWTPAEQSAGHRAVIDELVPAEHRTPVDEHLNVLDAYPAATAQARTHGQPAPPHPWQSPEVGEPALWAAAALAVWLSRQPQVSVDSPTLVREMVLTQITTLQARLDSVTPPAVADQDALDLLVHMFGGEDILQVPTDPQKWNAAHAKAVSIATQWLLDHDGATPTAAQAAELRKRVMGEALGAIVDTEDVMDAVPPDARRLDAEDADTVELLALRLLYGYLINDTPTIRDIAAQIDPYGELGYRLATGVIANQAMIWHNPVRATLTIRSSTLIPGMERIIQRVVPETKKRDTWAAYLPILIAITEEGRRDFRPRPTRDVESDLYLMAAFAAWIGEQPQVAPKLARQRLAAVVDYLARTDRTRSGHALTAEQRTQARERLRTLLGRDGAAQSRAAADAYREEDQLLAAGYDAQHDPNAVWQVQRLHAVLDERREDAREDARARSRATTTQERAARQAAERQLRGNRKKKR